MKLSLRLNSYSKNTVVPGSTSQLNLHVCHPLSQLKQIFTCCSPNFFCTSSLMQSRSCCPRGFSQTVSFCTLFLMSFANWRLCSLRHKLDSRNYSLVRGATFSPEPAVFLQPDSAPKYKPDRVEFFANSTSCSAKI